MLTNVTFNSVDAMPEGGTITIRSRVEGETVVLEVEDTGMGMTEDVQRKCLEPFFTTKGDDGTGLGLPMVYGIVRRHGGTVQIDSAPGEGTRFAVRLPIRSPAAVKEAGPPAVRPYDGPKGLRVLVIDDEPRILSLVSAYLERDEHVVETASDGREGLNKFRAGNFDIVITDRSMPKMNGIQLAVAAKGFRPETPVILLTGFGEVMEDQGEHPEGVDLILSKPVTQGALREAVSKLVKRA